MNDAGQRSLDAQLHLASLHRLKIGHCLFVFLQVSFLRNFILAHFLSLSLLQKYGGTLTQIYYHHETCFLSKAIDYQQVIFPWKNAEHVL